MRRAFCAIVLVLGSAALLAGTAAAQITFVPGDQLPVSNGPAFVATGDFNNDGMQDAVISHTISDKVAVLLGSANGFFSTPVSIAVGAVLRGVTTINANGDRNLDIAVAGFSPSRVYVISGNGNGTFGTPQPFNADRRGAVAVASGNFDDQNGPDLVTANGTANTVTVFINQPGNRGFVPQKDLLVGSNPRAIATGDFDSNGLADIVVVNTGSRGTDELALLLNNGSGSFQGVNPVNFLVGKGAVALTLADFNNDGITDVAVLNQGQIAPNAFTISILLTKTKVTSAGKTVGTGFFSVEPAFPITCPPRINGVPVNCTPQDIKSADFDGDGFQDLAVSFSTAAVDNSSTTAGFVSAYAGRGDGSFDFGLQVVVGLRPRQIAAADFTGDHIPDLIVTEEGNNTVRVLRGIAPPKKAQGRPCTASTQCDSGFCTNGVCCSSNTCPANQFCNIPTFEGDCAPPGPNGNRCTINQQCASGHCVDGFCCASTACPDGSFCNTGDCAPPADDGTPCTDPAQCVSGFCVDGICCDSANCEFGQFCNIPGHNGMCSIPGPDGNPCSTPEQCQSNFCTNHVCCSVEKCDAGLACNVPGHEGACSIVPTQTPTATRTPTATSTPTPQPNGASCGSGAQCVSGNCVNNVCCGSSSCPSDQRCDMPGHVGSCSRIGQPGDQCTFDSQCASGNCQAGSICAAARTPTPTLTPSPVPPGGPCSTTAQCVGGLVCNTVERVCCDQLTCPSGESCRVQSNPGVCIAPPTLTPTPTPKLNGGQQCDPSTPEACASGLCTNNVCCDATDCPAPMRCDIFNMEGNCEFPLDAGQDCDKTSDCATGLVCSFNLEVNHRICSLPPTPTPMLEFDTPTPVQGPIISASRSGGCSIGERNDASALWILGVLPLGFWMRRKSVPVDVRATRQ